MKLVIYGRIPSKKNNKKIIPFKGRYIIVSSTAYEEWHKVAGGQIYHQLSGQSRQPYDSCDIRVTMFAPDKRRADLSNKCESVLDLLVDCRVLADDSWFIVKRLDLVFGGVDKLSPRAEIEITKI